LPFEMNRFFPLITHPLPFRLALVTNPAGR
jgi:hypothetical protein